MLDQAPYCDESQKYIECFFDYLQGENIVIGDTGRERLEKVFQRLQFDFSGVTRLTGELYITHLIEVTKIFIDSVGISNITYEDLIISLLHDSIEDVDSENFESIQKDYGTYVALGVSALSKPDISDKTERDIEYYKRFNSLQDLEEYILGKETRKEVELNKGDRKKLVKIVASIKISDRIHNLCTMPIGNEEIGNKGFSIARKESKIIESIKELSGIVEELGEQILTSDFAKAILYGTQAVVVAKKNTILNA